MVSEQTIASDPALSAWVSASAGTGKTQLLTDRVLRLLLAGASPARILCITYTKAASAEMQQRIEKKLGIWAICSDDDLRRALTELTSGAPSEGMMLRARQLFALVLDSPVRLRIQTIHAFCQSVLARFPLEAGVMPHFTLIDEYTAAELLRDARTRLFTHGNDEAAEAIEKLTPLMSESGFNELIRDILNDRRKFLSWFDGDGAARLRMHIRTALGVADGVTMETLAAQHFRYTPEEEQGLRHALAALEQEDGKSDMATSAALRRWLGGQRDYEVYCDAYITLKNEPRKSLCTASAIKHWPPLKETLLAEQRRAMAFSDAYRSLRIAELSAAVMGLARALLDIYRHLKTTHGYMDYDDLIFHTVKLLKDSSAAWVLYKLDGGIDHILVDEAQDTSPEQWKLVDMLTAEFFAGEGAQRSDRTLFVVGDEKQSIFSFQGAEPQEFDRMQRHLSKRIEASGAAFRRVRLALSYRSTEPVLKAVDAVFAAPDAKNGLVFTEQDISHELHRKDVAGRVEFWPLIEPAEKEAHTAWHIPDDYQRTQKPEVQCAEQIAGTIAAWLREKRPLESQGRPMAPGDILILVQRRGSFARAMLRALKKLHVPVAGADRLVLTEHIAVQDCMALAQFLLLPQDDLTLATVLKSPLVGLNEEALFELAYDRGEQTLWQRLRSARKYEKAADYLSDLLSNVDYLPPHELFVYVLETLGGRKQLAARLGSEIDDPLNEFLSLAQNYAALHPPSLQGFLHWLQNGATEIKRDMEQGRDEVRIMTAHGAKGLQAPIVFLPDTTRTPRYESGLLWTQGEKHLPLWSPGSGEDDAHFRALRESYRVESEQEYRRLLYVAMTRAADELYICGYRGHKAVSPHCWYELIKRGAEACEQWALVGDRRVMLSDQLVVTKGQVAAAKQTAAQRLPDWVRKAPGIEAPLTRPLMPSHMEAPAATLSPVKDKSARERGRLIHRLLQYLPDVAAGDRLRVAEQFTHRYGEGFTQEEQDAIAQEVLALLKHPDFAPVFGADSVAEAPVTSMVMDAKGQKLVLSGQIDRLAVTAGDVYIIDYKTNREVPANERAVPGAYLRQMDAYRQLIAQIYPDKTVHCALLWTSAPKLMVLSQEAMESVAA